MIIIACPLPNAVTHRGMGWMAAVIALPFIRVQDRALLRDTLGDQVSACAPVRVITDPEALLTCVARDHTDDGRTIIGIGAMPLALIRAPTGRIRGVAMGSAFFPPRSDTVHPPQRRCRSSPRSARGGSGWLGYAVAGYAAVCVTPPTRARGGRSARLWQAHAAAPPAWLVVAASFRRPSSSAEYSSHHRPDSDKLEKALGHETRAVRSDHSAGRRAHAGGGDVPAKSCKYCHPGARRSGSQSCRYDSISSTVATHEPNLQHCFGIRILPLS
jgi:hypothetical protein